MLYFVSAYEISVRVINKVYADRRTIYSVVAVNRPNDEKPLAAAIDCLHAVVTEADILHISVMMKLR